jgi:3-deoxy-7-phosphoheptulonate synthase
MKNWKKDSWKNCTIKHVPLYKDQEKLDKILARLNTFPPLVFAGECNNLKAQLAKATERKAFLVQGGDCAESFKEFSANNIRDTFRVLLQMSAVITSEMKVPVIKLGRIAGQFTKPRSLDTETVNGTTLNSYYGDSVNGIEFTKEAREPDPERLLRTYSQSASTLNLLRSFAQGGFANLRKVNSWNMGFVRSSKEGKKYEKIAHKITEYLDFMDAVGINTEQVIDLNTVDFYTSHEGLHLPYEEALTRVDSLSNKIYCTSAHFIWIGDRTRFIDSAHVEFCRGISNPIGIKCGPSLDPDELIKIIDVLNPDNEAGKISLIFRYGEENIDQHLPVLVDTINKHNKTVLWISDPMHGNTVKSSEGLKTRDFSALLNETTKAIHILKSKGSHLGGIHLEMTGQNVTECTGGLYKLSDKDLHSRYHTHCDPRLNANQALELSFNIAAEMEKNGY